MGAIRILPDKTQRPVRRQFATALVKQYEDDFPHQQHPSEVQHRVWNSMSFGRVKTREPLPEPSARMSRQHQAPVHRNVQRLYRPQDQRGVETVFVIMDRVTGQVLARVRGDAVHCEKEAEKLVRSQGGTLSDVKVLIEGEVA